MNIEERDLIKPIPFVREMCKGKPEEKILEAEQNLREYIMVIKRMCDRLEREGKNLLDF